MENEFVLFILYSVAYNTFQSRCLRNEQYNSKWNILMNSYTILFIMPSFSLLCILDCWYSILYILYAIYHHNCSQVVFYNAGSAFMNKPYDE